MRALALVPMLLLLAPAAHAATLACESLPVGSFCADASDHDGGHACGDGTTDGGTTVGVDFVQRYCDGSRPTGWSAGGPFVTAFGDDQSCTVIVTIVASSCPAQASAIVEAAPWGHVLP